MSFRRLAYSFDLLEALRQNLPDNESKFGKSAALSLNGVQPVSELLRIGLLQDWNYCSFPQARQSCAIQSKAQDRLPCRLVVGAGSTDLTPLVELEPTLATFSQWRDEVHAFFS